MGASVTFDRGIQRRPERRPFRSWAFAAMLSLVLASDAVASERYAVVVSGVAGGEKYAAQQQKWSGQLAIFLTAAFGFPDANVVILDEQGKGTSVSTAENIQRVFGELRRRVTADDTVLVVLIGHGTFDGTDAKFNLVGPDLTASQWSAMVDTIAGRVVVVNTTASSFPFLEQLSRRGRIVITATDSAVQRFTTVFPEYFIRAVSDPASDSDKNGRVSIWEAFAAASAGVIQHYERLGQLSTERPLLDDDGDGNGVEAGAPGEDGVLARSIFLDAEPAVRSANAALASLERERFVLEIRLEELKRRKDTMADSAYQAELEKILLQLSRITLKLRQGS
jgi:hypothetical protein